MPGHPRIAGSIFAATLLASASASGQTPDTICDFVKQVFAAQPHGFDALKSEAQNPAVFHNEVFHGAVVPNLATQCTLFLKSQAGRVTLPARYTCTLAQETDFATANRFFARTAVELRACLPSATFTVMYDGDGKDPDETFDWNVLADLPGFRLTLEMSNGISALADALSQGNPNSPHIAVDLDITDTSSEK